MCPEIEQVRNSELGQWWCDGVGQIMSYQLESLALDYYLDLG